MFSKILRTSLYKKNLEMLFRKFFNYANSSEYYTGNNYNSNCKNNLPSTLKSNYNYNYSSVLDIPFREVFKIKMHNVVKEEDAHMFMKIFAEVVRYLSQTIPIPELRNWFTKVLRYNCPLGIESPPLSVVIAYKLLENPKKLTNENIKLAYILGLCVDMLHCAINTLDDKMDNSIVRRNVPSWFTFKDVQNFVLLDALVIENSIYTILKNYLNDHPAYKYILELFHDTTIKTALGQQIDNYLTELCKKNIEYATMDKYCIQTKYKCGYFAHNVIVRTAMYLAGIYDDKTHEDAKRILLKIAHSYMVENDYMDCFGDVEISRKNLGDDIAGGKCNWMLVKAVERASPTQKKLLQRNIGSQDNESIEQVISIYKELNIPEIYEKYRLEFYKELGNDINNSSSNLPRSLLFICRKMTYKQNT